MASVAFRVSEALCFFYQGFSAKFHQSIHSEDGNPARANIKQALVGINPLVHSFRALSTLRRYSLRTASAAAKPCQGDSLESISDPRQYLYSDYGKPWNPDGSSCWTKTCQFTTPCSHFIFLIKDIMIAERPTTQLP
ncbi:hypothetical protein Tco_1508308 [Tanacetum coccineum]